MCMKLKMYLRFSIARRSMRFCGQPSDISALLACRQLSESSVLLTRGQPREISVLFPLLIHSLI